MNSNEYRRAMDELAAFHFRGGTRGKQGRSPLRRILAPFEDDIERYLRSQFGTVCAYTEVALDTASPLELAWHRPRGNATATTGDVSNEHYWWLGLDWRNWYTASQHVVSVKGNSFPVLGERMAVPALAGPEMPRRRGRLDRGLILDPCKDPASFWLRFGEDGRVDPRMGLLGVDFGLETIDELALNNRALRDSRGDAIDDALRSGSLNDLTPGQTPHHLRLLRR